MMADGAGRAKVQKYQLILPDILEELKRRLKLSTSGTTENLLNTDRQLEEILEDPQLTAEMKRMLYSDTLRRRHTFQDLERQKQAALPQQQAAYPQQQQNQLLAQLPIVQFHAAPPTEQHASPLLTSTPSPLLSQRSAAPMSMASAGPSSAKQREVWSRVSFDELTKPQPISPTLGSFGEVPFAPRKSDPLNRLQQQQASPSRLQNVPSMAAARLFPEVTGDDDESREGDLFQSPAAQPGGPFEQILSSVSPQFRGNVKNTLDALSQIPQDQFAIDPSTMEIILQGHAIPASHIIDVLKAMNAPSVNENRLPPGTRETLSTLAQQTSIPGSSIRSPKLRDYFTQIRATKPRLLPSQQQTPQRSRKQPRHTGPQQRYLELPSLPGSITRSGRGYKK